MNKYFKNIKSKDELRSQWKKLAKQFHPDLNKSVSPEIMQEINAEYDILINRFNVSETSDVNYKGGHSASDLNEMEKEILAMILKIIGLENVTIEIIGTWLWVSGNTFECREYLQSLGFKFSGSKKAWYWFTGIENMKKKPRYAFCKNLDEVKSRYNSQKVENEKKKKVASK